MRRTRHDRPFVVEVGAISRARGSRKKVLVRGEIADLAITFSAVPEGSPVELDAVLESVHEGILITGTVRARWEGACRRCLGQASGEIVAEVRELCAEGLDDELVYALSHDELDLEPVAHDACILELPLAPLCREACQGLCPSCGADLNIGPCACEPPADRRWASLSLLGGISVLSAGEEGSERLGQGPRVGRGGQAR